MTSVIVRSPERCSLVLMPAKNERDGEEHDTQHVVGGALDVATHDLR